MPEDLGPDETQILAAMLGISEMVGGLTDIQEILGTVVRIIPQLVHANRCAIFSYDEKNGSLKCEQAFSQNLEEIRYLSRLTLKDVEIPKLSQKVLRLRLPALIRDAEKEGSFPRNMIETLKIRTMLVVPLVVRDIVLGIMILDDTRGNRYFTSKEINIVMGIATMTAIAIDSDTTRNELSTEKNRLKNIIDVLTDTFIILDAKFRVKHISEAGEKVLGWKSGELVGKQCSEVFRVTDMNNVPVCGSLCPGKRALWGENPMGERHKLSFLKKDGQRFPFEVCAIPIRNDGGEITEILYVLTRIQATPRLESLRTTEYEDSRKELRPVL